MTCPNCKRPLADDALYCNNCGHTIVDTSPAGPARKGLKFPAGKHLMDPSWVTCPFCAADTPPVSGEKPASELNKTKVSSGDAAGLSKTKVMSGHGPGGSAQSAGIAGHDARIVGALITYDWNKQGDMYPITEGKNFIGSGKSNDGPLCDICITQDQEMSREHALIRYFNGEGFILNDKESTNGTFINKQRIREEKLGQGAVFRTGRTTWRFISFDPKDASGSQQPQTIASSTTKDDDRVPR